MKRKALLGEFTAKAVLSDGQLAASQEEEKTKSGSITSATLSSCKLLQLCSCNRNLVEKNTICSPAVSLGKRVYFEMCLKAQCKINYKNN